MVSAAQNLANLHSVRNLVAGRLGVDPNNLTYEQRPGYIQAFALEVLKYPDQFDAATLERARADAGYTQQQLSDSSFSLAEFGGALVDEGAAINEDLNPFSASNRKAVLWLTVAGVALYFLAPRLIAAFLTSKAKEKAAA